MGNSKYSNPQNDYQIETRAGDQCQGTSSPPAGTAPPWVIVTIPLYFLKQEHVTFWIKGIG